MIVSIIVGYLSVGFLVWAVSFSQFDNEDNLALSHGVFWIIWFVVWLIKMANYTKKEIEKTFKDQ